MSTKTELGVWGFEHIVLYLCALVEKLHTAKPQGQLAAILVAARTAAQEGPKYLDYDDLHIHEPESDFARWNVIEQIANHLLDIVDEWASLYDYDEDAIGPAIDPEDYDLDPSATDRAVYEWAREIGREAEQLALRYLNFEDLAECALSVFSVTDSNRRNAAVTAMIVGHYDVALDIITRDDDG